MLCSTGHCFAQHGKKKYAHQSMQISSAMEACEHTFCVCIIVGSTLQYEAL